MAKHVIHYQNNPFYIGLSGMQLLFKRAHSVGIYAAILAGVGFLIATVANIIDAVSQINDPSYSESSRVTETFVQTPINVELLFIGIAVVMAAYLVILVIWLLLYGVLEHTSARLAQGEQVVLGQAFQATLKNFPAYVWTYLVMFVKIFLWSLLLIVPGIIMSVRYSLTGTVFFAENKRGNEAVKRSAELTKGAWFTTFAGSGLWNLMTLGLAPSIINPSANAILYRQFKETNDHQANKPAAHWLSWLTFFIPIVLFAIAIGLIIFLVLVAWLILQ